MYLQIEKISHSFGTKPVLQAVTIPVPQGQLVTLLGPSGCGKTTLLKVLGGFLRPDSGRVLLEGEDITALPPEKRPVATVFQNYALFPHMTVLENVMYGLRYRAGWDKSKARAAAGRMLALVHMEELAAQNVTRLSGGQQQRVALARALVVEPKVLLLDEPLSNLDAKLRVQIRQEIRDIQRQLGMTMLFVTHDQEEAMSLSDQIVVLREGHVEQIGTPQEVYAQPGNDFVADFVGRVNRVPTAAGIRLLRPEQLLLTDSGGDCSGTIVRRQFMGAYTIYFIAVGDEILQADVRSFEEQGWGIGDTVQIRERSGR